MKRSYILPLSLGLTSLFSSCNLHMREAREGDRQHADVEIVWDGSSDNPGKKPSKKPAKTPENGISGPESVSGTEIRKKYATTLKTTPDQIYNEKLYSCIDGWLGVKYKWGGNDKTGVDCSGFTNAVYREVYNYQLKRSAYDIIKECKEIDKKELSEGDLVFFDISSKNSHVGIYLANNKFVHASTSKGVMISDINEAYWTKYWGRAARIK